jgi:hypothetical protein
MAEDPSLCFSTSLREHCIYSRVPCSILHCPLPLPQPPSIELTCPRTQLPGLRSRNIFCTLHFHYRSPIPQGTYRVRLVPQRNLLARQSTSITENQALLPASGILVRSAPGVAGATPSPFHCWKPIDRCSIRDTCCTCSCQENFRYAGSLHSIGRGQSF